MPAIPLLPAYAPPNWASQAGSRRAAFGSAGRSWVSSIVLRHEMDWQGRIQGADEVRGARA